MSISNDAFRNGRLASILLLPFCIHLSSFFVRFYGKAGALLLARLSERRYAERESLYL
jgi:hypothetical protein